MAQLVNRVLSPRKPGFAPGSVHVELVVDKAALGKISLRVLRFSPVNIIPPGIFKLVEVSGQMYLREKGLPVYAG
jgi:hypothetical protein